MDLSVAVLTNENINISEASMYRTLTVMVEDQSSLAGRTGNDSLDRQFPRIVLSLEKSPTTTASEMKYKSFGAFPDIVKDICQGK